MSNALNPEIGGPQERALTLVTLEKALQRLAEPPREPITELPDEDGIDFRRYAGILLHRKWTVVSLVILSLVVALVLTYNTVPVYRSTLLLQIEPQADRFLEYQGNMSMGEPVWDWNYYQTQYDLLKSRTLARRVIDQLGLEAVQAQDQEAVDPSFLGELGNSVRQWLAELGASQDAADRDVDPATSRINLEGLVVGSLSVEPNPDSRLVNIHYDSTDPEEAAAVANALAENFINMTLERRYDATAYAKKFLEERIEQVRANLEDSEQRFITYAREREIVDVDDKLGSLLKTLQTMNNSLVEVEAERIEAEAQYLQSLEGKGPGADKLLQSRVIQTLKERKGELELSYQEQLKTFKPGYPKMQRLREQIAEIEQQIAEESKAISEAVKTAYEAKLDEQAALQERVREMKTEILDLQNRSTDYQALKREVDTNRELYDGLLQRMKEVGVVAGISTNNVSIVDRALVPEFAYKPNMRKNLAIALVIGLIAGVAVAFLFEFLDDTVKTGEDVESRTNIPVLGVLPLVLDRPDDVDKGHIALFAAKDPKSALAEAARSLRTSLIFSTSDGAPRVMHVTSAGPGEGKSTAASNVAITFAMTGSTVLLIDADLRAPSLHGVFGIPNTLGLTNYLAGDSKPADITQSTPVERLFSITSGPLPPNPVELLSSASMVDLLGLASERFDYVIIDGPPVVGLADALVLASVSAGTILVVDSGRTRYGALEGAVKRLRAANSSLLGTVVNRLAPRGHGYGYSYRYNYNYNYHYSYGDRAPDRALPDKA